MRLKYKNRKSLKRNRGGNRGGTQNEFTLMTFNIEILLQIFKVEGLHISCETLDECKDKVIGNIDNKLQEFKNLFNNVDIACIKENIIVKNDSIYLPLFKKINDLEIVSLCHSHKFEWDISKKLYGSEGKISNSIYCNPSKCENPVLEMECCDVPMMGTTPRCYSISTLKIHNTPITIASFHASGGRFEDIQALKSDNNSGKKIEQVEKIMEKGCTIVCGDFNTKLYNGETKDTDNYFKLLLSEVKKTNSSTSDDIYWKRYMTWMFGIDAIFKNNGYQSAYGNAIGDTTMYGGTVDMIYYNPTIVSIKVGSVKKMNEAMIGKKSPYTPYLSDHFPVKVTFLINTLPHEKSVTNNVPKNVPKIVQKNVTLKSKL
jgi:endonuclease/exonuclease/phosphatase family metal-dependent hydrolase